MTRQGIDPLVAELSRRLHGRDTGATRGAGEVATEGAEP